jgi:hypothetical protein
MIPDHTIPVDDLPCGCVNSHFLDSGAFTQWTLAQKFYDERKTNGAGRWDYYSTDLFFQYLDDYAAFIKKHHYAIDLYANLDVIGNAKLTWRNQKLLENLGLKPVPVIHYGTSLKWLEFYMKKGYEIIGLGGLVGSTAEDGCKRWIDQAFEMTCPAPERLPVVKLHGFGVTTYSLLINYPWYSVDSTSWTKVGAFGGILIPHLRAGRWDFSEQPYLMKVADDKEKEDPDAKSEAKGFITTGPKSRNPDRRKAGKHLLTLSGAERETIKKWLKHIGVPMGEMDEHGVAIEHGVCTHHVYRKAANLLFFEELRKWLPDWPWKFKSTRNKGFGLV